VVCLEAILHLLKLIEMNMQEKIKFKKSWEIHLEKRFWKNLSEQSRNLKVTYPFSFCSLESEVRADENGSLYLCFLFEERQKRGNAKIDDGRDINVKILKDVFISIFGNNKNEKYIGFYQLSKKESFKNVLRALFILGNEIDEEELNFFLTDEEAKIICEKVKNANLNADELFTNYVKQIVDEFEIIAKKVSVEIYKNPVFAKFSESFLKMFPMFDIIN
jgi:hypothetical protein